MPRFRTIALATLVSIASMGLAAGLAWRWMLREALLVREGKYPTLREVLRPRGTELRAALWGIAFLPVFWGGYLTFLSPLPFNPFYLQGNRDAVIGALVTPWIVVVLLCAYMRFLYARASVPRGEAEPDPDASDPVHVLAWRRHLKVALGCGLPGLGLCSIALVTKGEIAVLALPTVVPAVLAPLIGALSALPVLARGLRSCAPDPMPAAPLCRPRRAVAAAAGVGIVAAWAVVVHILVEPPRRAPLLERSDFDEESICREPYAPSSSDPYLWDEASVREGLASAGVQCAEPNRVGALRIGNQRLTWCSPTDVTTPTRFVAFDEALSHVLGRVDLLLRVGDPIGTESGAVALTASRGDDLRVVRIGRGAVVDAEWRSPLPWTLWTHLQPLRTQGVALSWRVQGDRVAVVELRDDLTPVAAPVVVRTRGQVSWVQAGERHLCVGLYGAGAQTLVLDRRRSHRPWVPGLWHRLGARSWPAFHVVWTGLLFVSLGLAAARARRARRAFARSSARGALCDGTLAIADDGTGFLHRADGEVVKVRTNQGAALFGYANRELVSGPCVIVGARTGTAGAAYRGALPEIDAAACFGIVQGDLVRAQAWAIAHAQRSLEAAILTALLVAGPALALLLLL